MFHGWTVHKWENQTLLLDIQHVYPEGVSLLGIGFEI